MWTAKEYRATDEACRGLALAAAMSSSGQRVLCFAFQLIDLDDFETLRVGASGAELAERVERDMMLLAPVSIEDNVCADVPLAIKRLSSNVKLWMVISDDRIEPIERRVVLSCLEYWLTPTE